MRVASYFPFYILWTLLFFFPCVLIRWEWPRSIFHAIHGIPFLGEQFLFGPERIPRDSSRSIRHEYCVTIFCWSKKIRNRGEERGAERKKKIKKKRCYRREHMRFLWPPASLKGGRALYSEI